MSKGAAPPIPYSMRRRVIWVNRLIRFVLIIAAKTRIFVRPTIIGRENLAVDGGVVIAPNHQSIYDAVSVFATIVGLRRDIAFLAMAELFRNRLIGRVLRWFGIIPVHRGTNAAVAASTDGVAVLEAGGTVVVFIEGEISLSGDLLPPKNGVAYMASAAGVPVVPVALIGTNRVKRPRTSWWRWGWRRRYTIVFGEPMQPPPSPSTSEQRREFSAAVMRAIQAMIMMNMVV